MHICHAYHSWLAATAVRVAPRIGHGALLQNGTMIWYRAAPAAAEPEVALRRHCLPEA